MESQPVFASQLSESKVEWTKNLALEVFDDTLSFAIKNIRVKFFGSVVMFDGVEDCLLET